MLSVKLVFEKKKDPCMAPFQKKKSTPRRGFKKGVPGVRPPKIFKD